MIQWIIIGVLILIGIWYFKVEHHTRTAKAVVFLIIGALLYFSMMGVFSSDNVDLTSPKGVVNAVYIYFGWMGNAVGNLWDIGSGTAKTVGNAIKINGSNDDDPMRGRLLGRGR